MWGHLSPCEPLVVTPVLVNSQQHAGRDLDSMGRVHSLCIPGYNGPWWPSERLERGWFYSPQAPRQEDVVEEEHVPAGMQELCSQQAGDPQKPSAQGESPQMSVAKSCLGCVPGARAVPGQMQDDGGQYYLTKVGRVAGCLEGLQGALQATTGSLSRVSFHPQLWFRGPPCSWSCSQPQSPIQSLRMVVGTCSRVCPWGSPQQPGKKGTWAALPAPQSPVWHEAPEGSNSPWASPVLAARYKTGGSCHCPPCLGLAVCG